MRARRIPLSHGAHVTRWHPVRPDHGMVPFESALERDCIGFLARHPGFLRIRSQPTTIGFVHAGHARRYTPDFLANFECVPNMLATLGFALQTYVEVKYAEQAACRPRPSHGAPGRPAARNRPACRPPGRARHPWRQRQVSGRPDNLTAIDAASWAEALRRDQVLRPLAESDGPVSRSEAGAVASRLGISQRWAFALLHRLRADLRTSALLARDRGRPHGLRLLQPDVEAVVEEQVRGYYAAAQKPSKQDLFEAIRRECRKRGLRPPGIETVRRRLRATDPVAIAAGRHGRKVARDCHGPAKEHFEPSTQLLGLVEIDHTRQRVA